MQQHSDEYLLRLGRGFSTALLAPAVWALFWAFEPSARHFWSEATWQRWVIAEPVAAFWLVLALRAAHPWFEREFGLRAHHLYLIARTLFWANLVGLPAIIGTAATR